MSVLRRHGVAAHGSIMWPVAKHALYGKLQNKLVRTRVLGWEK